MKAEALTIKDLGLTTHVYNVLVRVGIKTVQDLTGCTKTKLRHIPRLSEENIAEIEQALKSRGLSLVTALLEDDNVPEKTKHLIVGWQKNRELIDSWLKDDHYAKIVKKTEDGGCQVMDLLVRLEQMLTIANERFQSHNDEERFEHVMEVADWWLDDRKHDN